VVIIEDGFCKMKDYYNKEVKVRDMVGQEIGSILLKAVKEKSISSDKQFAILNDTVSTLLRGKDKSLIIV